ncbi:MAG: hypothetical protein FJX59_01045 [Alphaproteobacteria bacterium]|nr:hypothetical protein [Alphaproteobacteria bacterium]
MIRLATTAFALLSGLAWSQSLSAERTGPNKNIVRSAEGTILYRRLKDQSVRGHERWRLMVHPDGTRTLITHNDIFDRHVVMNAIIRVRADFYPVESMVAYWNDGRFKGTGLFRIADGFMYAEIVGPEGRMTQRLAVDRDRLSILTHPLAVDGWHGGSYDRAKGGAQAIPVINLDAIAEGPRPVFGSSFKQTWHLKGTEKITVPAGTFEAERYDVGDFQVWTMGPDRILVRFSWPKFGNEYVLETYSSNPK